jgi:lysophospholipase L1-like esterase
MKKLLILFFTLVAYTSFAQTRLGSATYISEPVDIGVSPGYTDLHSMFVAEGKRDGWSTRTNSTTAVGTVIAATPAVGNIPGYIKYSVNVSMPFTTTARGRAVEIQGGFISCTKAATGGYFLDNPNASYPPFGFEAGSWSCEPNGPFLVPGGSVIRFGAQLLNASISTITDVFSGTVTPAINSTAVVEFGYSAGVSFIATTDDLNYKAEYVIEVDGDSKLNGIGPTSINTMLAFLIRNYYSAKGYNVRLRNNSVSSSTSMQHEFAMNSGRYSEAVKAQLVLQDLTTNNVLGAVNADTTGKSNARIATYLATANPGAVVLVFAGTPRNDGFQANAAATNTAVSTAITGIGNTNIKYVGSVATAWTPTDASKYVADGLHPNDSGNLAWWVAVRAFLDANVPTLPKPRPR